MHAAAWSMRLRCQYRPDAAPFPTYKSGLLQPSLRHGGLGACRSSQRSCRSRLPQRVAVAAASETEQQAEASADEFAEMLQLAQGLQQDPERPVFHVMSNKGWINDPNGPIFHDGRYHLFYQHIMNGCEWDFGIVWGHAISTDLVHWQHLPPALLPTPGGADADGCFSGCCILDSDGTPTILYTGVRLRSNPECGPLPPADQDLNLPFVECQLSAVPADNDRDLASWRKHEAPLINLPPADLPLVGWRDPFIFEVGGEGRKWGMLMGSGLKGRGGSVIIYRADTLLGEWKYDGMLCEAENMDTGAMWECPLLLELQSIPDELRLTGLGRRGDTALRSHVESYRSQEGSVGNSMDDRSSQSSGDEGSMSEESTVARNPAAEPFQHASVDADPCTMAGHPEEGEAGQSVADGTAPGMDGATLDLEAAESAAASLDGSQPAASDQRMEPGIDSQGQRKSPTHMQPLEPQRPKVAPLPVAALSQQLADANLHAEPPPQLQPHFTHFLCVSPDAPTNPVLYWLGRFDAAATEFLLAGAKGPIRLDLGDTMYAPNLQTDALGRHVMWGWLQERRNAGSYDYSGCMTVPRLLLIEEDRLIQVPVPEIERLRTGQQWSRQNMEVSCKGSISLPGHLSSALDIHICLRQVDATSAGLLFKSWKAGGEGSAAILFDFDRKVLQAIFEGGGTNLDTAEDLFEDDETVRRVGGSTELAPGKDCHLRVLVDHSCIEVYAGTGEVLSTRIYRGHPPQGADSGISFVAFGGTAQLVSVDAWEMGTIWRENLEQIAAEAAAIFEPAMPAGLASPAAQAAPVRVQPISVGG